MSKKVLILLSSLFFLFFSFQHSLGVNTDTINFLPVIKSVEINPFFINSDNYFIITVSAEGDISSVSVKLTSPSGLNKTEVKLKKVDQNWSASFSIPSDFETGSWGVSEIVFANELGSIKKYSSDIVNKSFNVEKEVSLDILDTETVNEQQKQVCVQDGGIWDTDKIICKCSFNYSDWSECASDGFRTRSILSSSPKIALLMTQLQKKNVNIFLQKTMKKVKTL